MKRRPVLLNFSSDEEFARAAATHVGRIARKAIGERGRFDLAISGGESPRPVFAALQSPSLFPSRCWEQTHVFFVDERMVEPDSPLSNAGNAARQLLDHVPIPPNHVHPMPTSGQQPDAVYAAELATHFRLNTENPWPVFDLIILGMGGDGHTASLFPGSAALGEQTKTVVTTPAPDQDPRVPRMTLTYGVLNRGREVSFWIRGAGKHGLIREIISGSSVVPAAAVHAARQSWHLCPPLA